MRWQTSRFNLNLANPCIMGVVNLTPDSFSDGGQFAQLKDALRHAEQLLQDGAAILDVGAESSRPGAEPVPVAQELARILPFLREAVRWQVPISVDTYKPEVMQAALDLGVDIVNDIWGFRQPGAASVVAAHPACGLCLMHMHREPQSMQLQTMQGDVVDQVNQFLGARLQALKDLGVDAQRVVLDPGIGFGKDVRQNFQLLARQMELLSWDRPLVAAWSRKSSLGSVLADEGQVRPPAGRLLASVAAALMAVERGARVVRVHDVKDTADALKIWQAVRSSGA